MTADGDLPEGYHPVPRAQAEQARPAVERGCCPRGTGWSGCATTDGMPLRPSLQPVIAAENLIEKHLIQNQMFGTRQTAGQRPRPKSLPDLHQLVHQRLG